jgi:pimeloyl-ACP methyl ester carboxylesterase
MIYRLISGDTSDEERSMDVWEEVTHHFADNNGTRIHYVSLGEGDPVVFVHGFPDFWYSWRYQMAALSPHFRTIAIDNRGYNESDKPRGVEQYAMDHLMEDVKAVIDDIGAEKVNLVGHDWGGVIAWMFTMHHQALVERLTILNLTHPRGYASVVSNPTPEQKSNVAYAHRFAASPTNDEPVPQRVLDAPRGGDEVDERYRHALGQSYWDGMTNYYRANYGGLADQDNNNLPDITCPVLQFHGLKDSAVDKDGLRDTWNWITADYTLVTNSRVGHFIQWESPELVSNTMKWWLLSRSSEEWGGGL